MSNREENALSQREKIISFLTDKTAGKTLYTPELVYKLESGKLEGVYSDRIVFSSPGENLWGFSFDMFIIADEKVYELDERGNRVNVRIDHSGVSVFRFELAERKSSGQITGLFRLLTTSNTNQTAQGIVSSIFDVTCSDSIMSWKEEQCLYRDQPSENGYTPVSFHAENNIHLDNGKVVFEYNAASFDVDIRTFVKIPSKSTFPSFIAKEI